MIHPSCQVLSRCQKISNKFSRKAKYVEFPLKGSEVFQYQTGVPRCTVDTVDGPEISLWRIPTL